jgi:hypothetical protein
VRFEPRTVLAPLSVVPSLTGNVTACAADQQHPHSVCTTTIIVGTASRSRAAARGEALAPNTLMPAPVSGVLAGWERQLYLALNDLVATPDTIRATQNGDVQSCFVGHSSKPEDINSYPILKKTVSFGTIPSGTPRFLTRIIRRCTMEMRRPASPGDPPYR